MKMMKEMHKNQAKKILVIDDDEAILEAFALTLADEHYVVETSLKDGDYVLNRTLLFKPNLIILDLLLSGADGRDICKKLKAGKETSEIPIIMISAHPDAKDSALQAGADDFLSKPFEINELLRLITKYLR